MTVPTHVFTKGETALEIAARYQIDLATFIDLNDGGEGEASRFKRLKADGSPDVNYIREGQPMVVGEAKVEETDFAKGTTLEQIIKERPGLTLEQLVKANYHTFRQIDRDPLKHKTQLATREFRQTTHLFIPVVRPEPSAEAAATPEQTPPPEAVANTASNTPEPAKAPEPLPASKAAEPSAAQKSVEALTPVPKPAASAIELSPAAVARAAEPAVPASTADTHVSDAPGAFALSTVLTAGAATSPISDTGGWGGTVGANLDYKITKPTDWNFKGNLRLSLAHAEGELKGRPVELTAPELDTRGMYGFKFGDFTLNMGGSASGQLLYYKGQTTAGPLASRNAEVEFGPSIGLDWQLGKLKLGVLSDALLNMDGFNDGYDDRQFRINAIARGEYEFSENFSARAFARFSKRWSLRDDHSKDDKGTPNKAFEVGSVLGERLVLAAGVSYTHTSPDRADLSKSKKAYTVDVLGMWTPEIDGFVNNKSAKFWEPGGLNVGWSAVGRLTFPFDL